MFHPSRVQMFTFEQIDNWNHHRLSFFQSKSYCRMKFSLCFIKALKKVNN